MAIVVTPTTFTDTTSTSDIAAATDLENVLISQGYVPSTTVSLSGIVWNAVRNLFGAQISPVSGGALSARKSIFSVTGLTDNTAQNMCTVNVPNATVGAVIRTTFVGSLGAGGAIGAGEAVHAISYDFIICRTAGVAAVALIATATGSCKQAVAGADTVTTLGAVSSVTGAVGAANTFQLTLKVTKGAGASANHYGFVIVEVINQLASGVTLSVNS